MKEQDPRGGGQYPYEAKEIREALDSVDTRLKINFTKFCKENYIIEKADGWKLIPPAEEVNRIADAMKSTLAKYGLDYTNLDSIWPPYKAEVVQAARDAMQSIRREKFQQSINADLSELLKREKPLFSAQNVTTEIAVRSYLNGGDPEAIMYEYKDVRVNSNMIGNDPIAMTMLVNPMHVQWPTALSYNGITAPIHEVLQLNNGGTAIVTDRAIFVTDHSSSYTKAMIETYQDLLKEQNIELPIAYEKEGYDTLMSYYATPEHKLMDQLFANKYYSQEKTIAALSDYFQNENMSERASAFILSDPNSMINAAFGSQQMQVSFDDVQLGMMLTMKYNQTEAMDLVDPQIDLRQLYQVCVIGTANVAGEKILITDMGILARKDISQELGFEINRGPEHTIE